MWDLSARAPVFCWASGFYDSTLGHISTNFQAGASPTRSHRDDLRQWLREEEPDRRRRRTRCGNEGHREKSNSKQNDGSSNFSSGTDSRKRCSAFDTDASDGKLVWDVADRECSSAIFSLGAHQTPPQVMRLSARGSGMLLPLSQNTSPHDRILSHTSRTCAG